MQVLDDQQDRAPLPEPTEDTEDALQQARLTALRHDRAEPTAGSARPVDARREARDQPDDLLGRRAEDLAQVVVRQLLERGPERSDQRLVRRVGGVPVRGRRA